MIIGVDPGVTGGICALNDDGTIFATWIMPIIKSANGRSEYDILVIDAVFKSLKKKCEERNEKIFFIIEKVTARPINGSIAVFSLGYCLGMLQGILTSLQISYELVSPQEWMRGLNITSKDEKGSIKWAIRKFPNHEWKRTERCTTYHSGLTDSVGISFYLWMRNNKGDSK